VIESVLPTAQILLLSNKFTKLEPCTDILSTQSNDGTTCLECWLWQDDQHFWRFNSLSPPPNSAPIDCTTPIHRTQTFMDVHQTFVSVNQQFNYSSLLETGNCNRRQFKNSLQLGNLPECLWNSICAREKHQISSLQNCTFVSLIMAGKNNVGQFFNNFLRKDSQIFCWLFNDVLSIETIQRRMMRWLMTAREPARKRLWPNRGTVPSFAWVYSGLLTIASVQAEFRIGHITEYTKFSALTRTTWSAQSVSRQSTKHRVCLTNNMKPKPLHTQNSNSLKKYSTKECEMISFNFHTTTTRHHLTALPWGYLLVSYLRCYAFDFKTWNETS
jgi:hypothetical protein